MTDKPMPRKVLINQYMENWSDNVVRRLAGSRLLVGPHGGRIQQFLRCNVFWSIWSSMKGFLGNYGGIMLFNVIINYHKKNEANGWRRSSPDGSRAKDDLAYAPETHLLFAPHEVGSVIRQTYATETHLECKTLASGVIRRRDWQGGDHHLHHQK